MVDALHLVGEGGNGRWGGQIGTAEVQSQSADEGGGDGRTTAQAAGHGNGATHGDGQVAEGLVLFGEGKLAGKGVDGRGEGMGGIGFVPPHALAKIGRGEEDACVGGRGDNGRGPHLRHGGGNGWLAVDHGMFAKQNNFSGRGGCRHRVVRSD